MKNTTSINVNFKTLEDLKTLVEHRDYDSWTTILDKIVDEFRKMKKTL